MCATQLTGGPEIVVLTRRENFNQNCVYGLGDGYSYTLEEVVHIFQSHPRSGFVQIEAQGGRKLHNPPQPRPRRVPRLSATHRKVLQQKGWQVQSKPETSTPRMQL